jgi:hypothetical protein
MADDPVANVQQFCNVLAQTNAELESVRVNLESYAQHLHEAQNAADERFNVLAETLHAFVSEAESATASVVGDVDELGTTAHEVATGRLAATGHGIDGSEDRLTQELHEGSQTLQASHDDLARDGFDASSTTLAAVNGDLDASQGAAAHAFEELAHGLDAHAKELATAGHTAEQAFATASAEVDQIEQAAGQALVAAAESWNNELISGAENAGREIASALDGPYAHFKEAATQGGHALVEEVAQAAKDVAERLTNEMSEQIQNLYDQGATPALEALETALGGTQKALGEGEESCNRLESMMPDLAVTKGKAAELESVIQAMD